MALLGQDLQRPRSLRRRRLWAARFRLRSLRSNGVSGTRFGFMASDVLSGFVLRGLAAIFAGLGVAELLRFALVWGFGERFGL